MQKFEKINKLKYERKDSGDFIFDKIRTKVNLYFEEDNNSLKGSRALYLKATTMIIMLVASYLGILGAHTFLSLSLFYVLFGFIFLILGINIGHDAAHNCVTGNHKTDNVIFQIVFGLQGLSGYVWKIRHNFSHHIFPNVYNNDTDLEISRFILLGPNQKKLTAHKYQHLYAPFLYMVFSLTWIYFADFELLVRKKHGNLRITKIPKQEILKLLFIKAAYLFIFILLPKVFTGLPFIWIIGAYLIMNFFVSVFLAFTFFISHHVRETEHIETQNDKLISTSWVKHQIVSTIDFSTNSMVGNFIFGGFNLHTAHHLFPEVSHIHYPAITRIIKDTLEENQLDWYKSFGFFDGVLSHLSFLRMNGQGKFKEKEIKTELEQCYQ